MNFLLTAIVAVLVFGTVVLVHEAGHFFAARHCGIHVEEFSIGFGPALWSTVRGGTRYSVRLLPLGREHLQPAPKGFGDPSGEVEMFPDAWTVFEQTAPIYMHGMIFGAMTESYCAEQSARMTAMDSATKSATDMIHALQLEYNRTRQGAITQEITEIIGGASAVQTSDY